MAYSSEWHKFLQNKEALVNDLKQALASPDDREMAFQLLAHMYPDVEILGPVLDEVLDTAIDSSNLMAIGLARQVLAKYRAEPSLRRTIPLFVTSYLADQDEWQYRRIAELYDVLGYEKELASFLLHCQGSANVEIREICDDFPRP